MRNCLAWCRSKRPGSGEHDLLSIIALGDALRSLRDAIVAAGGSQDLADRLGDELRILALDEVPAVLRDHLTTEKQDYPAGWFPPRSAVLR